MKTILDKTGRVIEGVNHGRKVTTDGVFYYKTFDDEYCRKNNFIKAFNSGFFEDLVPAFDSLIKKDDEIIGYKMRVGTQLSNSEFDFNSIPDDFYQKLLTITKKTKLFFYDLVPTNIIITEDGNLSLIDLESVYPIEELYKLEKHHAKVKPDFYFNDLEKIWKENMKPISFIQPSRNNLKYLKWSYNSIRKNLGYIHEICMADDFSNDGTWEWLQEISETDPNVKIHRNEGPKRLGHTILYDTLINDYATNDIVMIYHADMYALPGLDEEIDKHIKPGVVVSLTRIEPPLHPDGPEKILMDYGIEPEEFKEQDLLREYESFKKDTTTEGIFAPWAIMKEDFQKIGGHDSLYAPQSKEDSDIFNRFVLAGYKLVQTWSGFVYHMTCRGSRFADGAKRNPTGEVFMKNRETDEWLKQNHRSTRNFIRKWGHFVKHDSLMKPIIPPKYDIGFVVKNCTFEVLYELEPWCSKLYADFPKYMRKMYIKEEQKNTLFDLEDRVQQTYKYDKKNSDIIVEFDAKEFTPQQFNYLAQLSEILSNDDKLDVGEFNLGIFTIMIHRIKTYEKDLVICEK